MTRRAFLPAAASAVAAGNAAAADAAKNVILELRRIQLRNGADNQRQRNNDYLKLQVAALGRAGAGPRSRTVARRYFVFIPGTWIVRRASTVQNSQLLTMRSRPIHRRSCPNAPL